MRSSEREEAEQRDVQIINAYAEALNAEAEDALSYQAVPWDVSPLVADQAKED